MRLFIQPVGGERGQRNYDETINKDVSVSRLQENAGLFQQTDLDALLKLAKDGPLGAWGILSKKLSSWEQMQPGDVVLFYQYSNYVLAGTVAYKMRSQEFATKMWGLDQASHQTWECVYFLREMKKIRKDRRIVNRILGYKEEYFPHGFGEVREEVIRRIVGQFGSANAFVANLADAELSDQSVDSRMNLPKELVDDVISIAEKIHQSGIENKRASQSPDAQKVSEAYNVIVKPAIVQFEGKYGRKPNGILQDLLGQLLADQDLDKDFEPKGFGFYGQIIYPYVWAAITRRDSSYSSEKAHFVPKTSQNPQLYVLINRHGIKFGLCYGNHVPPEAESVTMVKGSEELRNALFAVHSTGPSLRLYSECPPAEMPDKYAMRPRTGEDLASLWTNKAHLISVVPSASLSGDIGDKIRRDLSSLVPVFKVLSGIESRGLPPAGVTYAAYRDRLEIVDFSAAPIVSSLLFEDVDSILERIRNALANDKHVILIGPPGTGKSELARTVCSHYVGDVGYEMCTASPDWSTFETIGGYRQKPSGELEFHPGLFLKCFQDQNLKPINKWLIVDEINRADIDKAFGPMFSALTGQDVVLPFERDQKNVKITCKLKDEMEIDGSVFIVPRKWRMIATMNTYDKSSLYEMSYAFMRRFAFVYVDVPPIDRIDEILIGNYAKVWHIEMTPSICSRLATLWRIINSVRKIGPALIKDMCQYVQASGSEDYVGALVMYLLPQLEGLEESKIVDITRRISQATGADGARIVSNSDQLREVVSGFFDLPLQRLKEEAK